MDLNSGKHVGAAEESVMGARDAYGAEIESNFADKVLGHADSLHIIKLPEGAGGIFGLAAKTCEPATASTPALTSEERGPLMKQVVGWKEVLDAEGRNALQFTWDVRDEAAGQMLVDRIRPLMDEQNHHGELAAAGTTVSCTFTTHSINDLSVNDFIMAAKVNLLEVADLKPKKKQKFWA